jgi:hypothetical protein
MVLRTGAIYSLRYTNWKTNYKIFAFVFWPGGGMTKTHIINLSARQLSIIDRTRIIRTVVRLSKIPHASKYNGRMLYKIFKTYLPREIRKCYRTYFTHLITQAALINYGLNKEEDFTEMELSSQSKQLFEEAQRDFQVKAMNLYSGRGAKMNDVKSSMAGDNTSLINDEKGGANVNKISGTRPATRTAIKEQQNQFDDDDFGY